jgi:hypothetical protein
MPGSLDVLAGRLAGLVDRLSVGVDPLPADRRG